MILIMWLSWLRSRSKTTPMLCKTLNSFSSNLTSFRSSRFFRVLLTEKNETQWESKQTIPVFMPSLAYFSIMLLAVSVYRCAHMLTYIYKTICVMVKKVERASKKCGFSSQNNIHNFAVNARVCVCV